MLTLSDSIRKNHFPISKLFALDLSDLMLK